MDMVSLSLGIQKLLQTTYIFYSKRFIYHAWKVNDKVIMYYKTVNSYPAVYYSG